ncbi:MAG: CopG family transcriptional regulator [Halobacteriaceae archaeon]
MAEEGPQADVPDDVGTWIDGRAKECGLTRAEFLRALADAMAEADGPFASRDRVSDLEDDVDEKIRDVRDRVLQVKREADGKASEDHRHAELERHLAATDKRVSDLAEAVDDLTERLDDAESRLDEGFENYEEVLDYLTETTDDLNDKTRTLATALLDVREGVKDLAEGQGASVDRLAEEANRRGVRKAACGDCGATLDIALLRDPVCPHCGATFSGVEPKSGWFGSHTLETGEHPPALEPPAEEDILDEERGVAAIAGDGGEPHE